MPGHFDEDALFRLPVVAGHWRNDARKFVQDMEEWRDAGKKLEGRVWPDNGLSMFGLSTSEVVAWMIAHRPLIDFQPIIRVYEFAQKWTADRSADRLPSQRDIETQWDVADLLVFSLVQAVLRDTPRPNRESGSKQPHQAVRDKHLEARDRWIYSECCKGTAYDAVAIMLKKKPDNWPRIESKQGIQNAAKRYAERNGLPPIPRRQE